ncbi:hypothetical protein P153DRAFT_385817 [Dothidotthia symphoricarpi CBS 119687]|uniref:Uncharacterized protein n=1 Tax=Dothidotthia symphoricarpi CBS 119687 TaxID=1392245 RepID=A0A6A6ACQ9_9PLEO|nr:uncharacterized protein P153DRAFT_385817 [Dothidotthia symphoricarpi CBS 119687]KAF2129609.1 hypothetical protein P153DRAFT_385817 [Dothidotthia symphoricarpi CBS 119687]
MSSTKIYHNITKLPIAATLVLIFGNYELYRIHKGQHPYWTPLLEAKGFKRGRSKYDAIAASPENGAKDSKDPKVVADAPPSPFIKWTNLNGVPIPTLDFMSSPRKEP